MYNRIRWLYPPDKEGSENQCYRRIQQNLILKRKEQNFNRIPHVQITWAQDSTCADNLGCGHIAGAWEAGVPRLEWGGARELVRVCSKGRAPGAGGTGRLRMGPDL